MALTSTIYKGTKGVYSLGKLKFKKDKQPLFKWAVESFNQNSKFGKDKNSDLDVNLLNSYLTYFLYSLEITSSHEGGFDAVNTYDRAGISVGFIQFARPNVGVYKLLTEINTTLRDEVKQKFGDYPVNKIEGLKYDDADSLKARKDKELITRVQNAIVTESGIKAQIKLAIEDFYDKAFEKFLTFDFIDTFEDEEEINPFIGVPTKNKNKNKKDNFVYASALIFDSFVNLGIPKASRNIKALPLIYKKTEGNFLVYNIDKIPFADERKQKWVEIFNKKFSTGEIFQ